MVVEILKWLFAVAFLGLIGYVAYDSIQEKRARRKEKEDRV